MTVNATAVFDLRKVLPQAGERYVLDTNVWLDLVYPALAQTSNQNVLTRIGEHSDFAKQCTDVGAHLLWCCVSFAEVAHVIERTECSLYNAISGRTLNPKQFRSQTETRAKTLNRIQIAWQTIESMGSGLSSNLTPASMVSVLADFSNSSLDAYDLFLRDSMVENDVEDLVTDDSDFLTASGLTILTANERALRDASRAGKLKN